MMGIEQCQKKMITVAVGSWAFSLTCNLSGHFKIDKWKGEEFLFWTSVLWIKLWWKQLSHNQRKIFKTYKISFLGTKSIFPKLVRKGCLQPGKKKNRPYQFLSLCIFGTRFLQAQQWYHLKFLQNEIANWQPAIHLLIELILSLWGDYSFCASLAKNKNIYKLYLPNSIWDQREQN